MKALSLVWLIGLLWVYAGNDAKLVVVSVDGGSDQIVDELLARGVLPPDGAFGRIARQGRVAEYLRPVNVSSTASSHAALFTGALPGDNGIVLNRFFGLKPAQGRPTSGFVAPLEAETIFQAVKRAGLRVICAPAVTADAANENRSCSETMPYPSRLANAALFTLQAVGDVQTLPGQQGRWRRAEAVGESADLRWLSGDATPLTLWLQEGDEPRLLVNHALAEKAVLLKRDEWQSQRMWRGTSLMEPWLRFDRAGDDLRLYVGQIYGFRNADDALMQTIFKQFGGWPGEPDHRGLAHGVIGQDEWRQQSLRQNGYLRDITLHLLQRKDWRMLVTYLPHVDDSQHHFMLRSPRQLDYHAEDGARRVRFQAEIEAAYQRVDAWLSAYMEAAPKDTRFLIMSDHGGVATHHVVFLNQLLADWGLAGDQQNPEVRVAAAGPSAFFYVDGRDAERQQALVTRLTQQLAELQDPQTGEPIFEVVRRRSELESLGLFHRQRAGQIFVSARPGWSLSMRLAPSKSRFLPNSYHRDSLAAAGLSRADQDFMLKRGLNEGGVGVHGHLSRHRMVHGLFYLWQPGVPAGPLGVVDALQVAPTIAALLGIEAPRQAKAKAVDFALK